MRHHRLITVDRLEQQKIRDLRSTAPTACHRSGRKRLTLLV